MDAGFEAIESAFRQGARTMDSVKQIAQMLRKLHSLDPAIPSVSLLPLASLAFSLNSHERSLAALNL